MKNLGEEAREIIGENLIGVYLQGSVATGCDKDLAAHIMITRKRGHWTLENIPEEYHGLLKSALDSYQGKKISEKDGEQTAFYDEKKAIKYAQYMLKEIKGEE